MSFVFKKEFLSPPIHFFLQTVMVFVLRIKEMWRLWFWKSRRLIMINVSSKYKKYLDCKIYKLFSWITFSTKLHGFMDLVVREFLYLEWLFATLIHMARLNGVLGGSTKPIWKTAIVNVPRKFHFISWFEATGKTLFL